MPLCSIKDLTAATLARYRTERDRAPFASLRDFFQSTGPAAAHDSAYRAGHNACATKWNCWDSR